jgi:hypothetical protein
MTLEYIPTRQVHQRLSEGWAMVSKEQGDYAALMQAPQGWEPVVGASESISLLYRVDGTLKRLDGKKPFKKQGFRATECRLPDCDGKHFGRGFCRKHYNRLKKHGSPRIVQPPGRAPRKCLQCEERVHAHGLCNRHYLMMRRAIKAASNKSKGCKSGAAKREAKRWEWADRKLAEAAL